MPGIRGCFDISKDDAATVSSTDVDENPLDTEQKLPVKLPTKGMDHETERDGAEIFGRQKSIHKTTIPGPRKAMSGSLLPKNFVSPNKLVGNGERDYKSRFKIERNHSGPLPNLQKNSMTNSLSEDVPEGSGVQRKGRFKITADSGPKPKVLNPSSGGMPSPPTPSIPAASLLTLLQSILQHNTSQREEILRLIKSLDQTSGFFLGLAHLLSCSNEALMIRLANDHTNCKFTRSTTPISYALLHPWMVNMVKFICMRSTFKLYKEFFKDYIFALRGTFNLVTSIRARESSLGVPLVGKGKEKVDDVYTNAVAGIGLYKYVSLGSKSFGSSGYN